MEVQKGTTNEIIVRGDRRLFAQMIVIAETRKLTMSSVLSHPLGPLPWALASPDGSLRKNNNGTFAKEPHKDIPSIEANPNPSACIIDGMSMV